MIRIGAYKPYKPSQVPGESYALKENIHVQQMFTSD